MTKGHLRLLALPLMVWAACANAQTTRFSLGLGFQWLDVSGNEDMYRSQLDERQGLVIQDFSFTSIAKPGSSAGADRVRVEASGFGGSGHGRLFLDAGLTGTYSLRVQYQRARHFNALPGLANPFLAEGITPGQHTMDRTSESVDVDLEILPGRMITPLVGYRWARYSGPAQTTYHVGQDEFRLASDFSQTTRDFQVGAALHLGTFAATVMQGWRSMEQSESATIVPGAGIGNNTNPLLGRDIKIDGLMRNSTASSSSPFTTGYLSGRIGDRVRVMGSYVKTDFSSDFTQREDAVGSLASFKLSRFFQGLTQTVAARAAAPDWRGEIGVNAEIVDNLDLAIGYTKRHRQLDGWAVISSIYARSTNFSGGDARDFKTLADVNNAMDRDEKQVEAKVTYRGLGPVSLWGSYAKADEALNVTPDAAEVVVPGGQGGQFDRSVKRYGAGANLGIGTLKLAADWRKDDADSAVVRIDALNQSRARLQAQWAPGKVLRIAGTAERLTGDNPTAGIGYDFTTKHYAMDVDVTPIEALSLQLGYGIFKSDSTVAIRQPQDFQTTTSVYAEDGKSLDASLSLNVAGRYHFLGGVSRFENTGNLGFSLNRTFGRVDVDLTDALGVTVSFDKRKYTEDALQLANYDADRLGFFFRWRQ